MSRPEALKFLTTVDYSGGLLIHDGHCQASCYTRWTFLAFCTFKSDLFYTLSFWTDSAANCQLKPKAGFLLPTLKKWCKSHFTACVNFAIWVIRLSYERYDKARNFCYTRISVVPALAVNALQLLCDHDIKRSSYSTSRIGTFKREICWRRPSTQWRF